MPVASRHMPKYQPPAGPLAGMRRWISISLLLIALAGLGVLMFEHVWVGFLVAALFVVSLVGFYLDWKRTRALAAERRELSICNFTRSFDANAVDTWVVRVVYKEVEDCVSNRKQHIAIKADDRFEEDLFIDMEDLEKDVAVRIARRTGRSLERAESNPYYGKITTVRGLVNFFNAQPPAPPN